METDFDKEMDALLRKAATGPPHQGGAADAHLYPDEMAAFAENAVPQATRAQFTAHIADCDRCRAIFSNLIRLNADAEPEKKREVPVLTAPVEELPWYSRLFRTPQLALTLGALVLVFGGLLGYMLVNSGGSRRSTEVSQVANTAGPESGRAAPVENANSAANTDVPAAAEPLLSNSSIAASNSASTAPAAAELPTPAAEQVTRSAPEKQEVAAPPPPAPRPSANNYAADAEAKQQKAAAEQRAETRSDAARAAGQTAPAAAEKAVTDEARAKRSMRLERPATRQVAGKTFERRDGVWYDSAFSGQATTNYRRGTDAYRRLDAGIRSFADTLGGTVVVVWNGKAYRIQ